GGAHADGQVRALAVRTQVTLEPRARDIGQTAREVPDALPRERRDQSGRYAGREDRQRLIEGVRHLRSSLVPVAGVYSFLNRLAAGLPGLRSDVARVLQELIDLRPRLTR